MIIVEGPDGSGKTTFIETLGFRAVKYRALRAGVGATQADGTCSDRTAPSLPCCNGTGDPHTHGCPTRQGSNHAPGGIGG